MSLLDKINDHLKDAMKKRDQVALEALRMIKSEIGYRKIDKGAELDDSELNALFASTAKKWKDAIAQFKDAGRDDLVEKESAKLEVLEQFLPKQLGDDELAGIIDEVIAEVGAENKADIGKVMKPVMERVRGQADGSKVKEIVSSKLS